MLDRLRALMAGAKEPHAAAGPPSALQLYSGYESADIEVVRRHAIAQAGLYGDHYIDGFGVKTLHACVPFADPAALSIERLQHPVPDDGFHAEGIEYVALLDAIDRFAHGGDFCAVEAGAGWGPWLAMAGVICRRRGVDKIRLVGLEASSERFELMRRHLDSNQLDPQHGVEVDLFAGAVWSHDGVIHFPESDVADMGAAASAEMTDTDYRGQAMAAREVPCTQLPTLVGKDRMVEFLHIDVQGAEGEVIASHLNWLNRQVKSMMIATHSRPLEGELMMLLNQNGWILHREKPCRFNGGQTIKDWCGATVVDGSQYWLNAKFT
ncbi:MAG: FkbM family methyltransferase [Proteobacteria bacterium]|nr:FkbM family methyltransferase [Pseudomonadota bacterium]